MDVFKLRWGHIGLEWARNPMADILTKKEVWRYTDTLMGEKAV